MTRSVKKRKKKVKRQTITMTPEVYRLYQQTIAQQEPETFALLGGRLDNPFHITEFRFCPPRKDQHGRYDASHSHVNVDHEYMNWVIDNEWVPNGKYMLGVWHSHPAGCTSPSYGDPVSNQGDVVFFSGCLDADDSPEQNWQCFIAPITTFDKDGKDQIHGWYLPKGSDQPVQADVRKPAPDVSMQNAMSFLKQCSYEDVKRLYHSSSLTHDKRHRLICLLHLAGQMGVAEQLIAEFQTSPKIDILA